jgi:hypothetical protein
VDALTGLFLGVGILYFLVPLVEKHCPAIAPSRFFVWLIGLEQRTKAELAETEKQLRAREAELRAIYEKTRTLQSAHRKLSD